MENENNQSYCTFEDIAENINISEGVYDQWGKLAQQYFSEFSQEACTRIIDTVGRENLEEIITLNPDNTKELIIMVPALEEAGFPAIRLIIQESDWSYRSN
jgi:hypothetical protein